MPFATINDLHLYYEVTDFTRPWEGTPPILLLLHGLHGHLGWWNWFQVAPLAQHARVITLDQRGHGRSAKPAAFQAGGYTIEQMAEDVAGLLDSLAVEQVVLCGASMGGMVSLQVALRDAERAAERGVGRVAGLILVDSYPHTPAVIGTAIQHWIDDVQARGYAEVMRTFNEDYADALFSPEFRAAHPEFPAFETKVVLDNLMPDDAFVGCCRAIQRYDATARLGEIRCPTLIMTSDHGMAYDEGLAMQRAIAGAQLWAPEGVGHSPHVERPADFTARVLEFLRGL